MDTQARLKIWQALSCLFLDTEIDDLTIRYIARTLLEEQVSLIEAEDILWREVYPVLSANLRSVAGVWDGWSDDWLLEHLPAKESVKGLSANSPIRHEIKRCWQWVVQAYEQGNWHQKP